MLFKILKVEVIKLLKERFLNIDNLRICYVEEGKGKNIIFIHGWQSSLRVWQYNLGYFVKNGYRILALDLPGYGKSDKPKINHSIDYFSGILKKIIEKKKMEKVSLICYSMGSFIGIDLALKYPQEIESLVLVGAPGDFGALAKRKNLAKFFLSKPLLRFIAAFAFLTLKLYLIGKLLTSRSREESRKLRELTKLRLSLLSLKSPYIHVLHSSAMDVIMRDFEREKGNLAKINQPVLIVRGEKEILDLFASPRNCQYLLSNIRSSKLVTLKNCGHYSMAEDPDSFNKVLDKFCQFGIMKDKPKN